MRSLLRNPIFIWLMGLFIGIVIILLGFRYTFDRLAIWDILMGADVNTSSTPVILERVQSLSNLVTVRHNFSVVVSSEADVPAVLRPLYGDEQSMVAVGYVNAGVDLSDLTEDDVRIVGDTLLVTLPEPKLFDCVLNEDASYVISRRTGFFASPLPELDSEARRFAIIQFRDSALESGILDEAQENARSTIRDLIGLMNIRGVTNVEFVAPVEPRNPLVFPEGCGDQATS